MPYPQRRFVGLNSSALLNDSVLSEHFTTIDNHSYWSDKASKESFKRWMNANHPEVKLRSSEWCEMVIYWNPSKISSPICFFSFVSLIKTATISCTLSEFVPVNTTGEKVSPSFVVSAGVYRAFLTELSSRPTLKDIELSGPESGEWGTTSSTPSSTALFKNQTAFLSRFQS